MKMKSILGLLKSLIPNNIRGKLFVVLTFLNLGLCSFFAGIGLLDSAVFSAVTAALCCTVWYIDLPNLNGDNE